MPANICYICIMKYILGMLFDPQFGCLLQLYTVCKSCCYNAYHASYYNVGKSILYITQQV